MRQISDKTKMVFETLNMEEHVLIETLLSHAYDDDTGQFERDMILRTFDKIRKADMIILKSFMLVRAEE